MPLPILSVSEMRQWEAATWAGGQTEAEVIRRVGLALANHAQRLTRSGDRVLLLAGPGHNGDDARAARDHLPERRVELLEITDPVAGLPVLEKALTPTPDLVVDGLFGIGLNRPLDAGWVALIQRLNQSDCPVLAVDAPSGLNADTGLPQPEAVRAALTLTVGAPKAGLLRPTAWPYVGRLDVAESVGLADAPAGGELQWTLPRDFHGLPPRRSAEGHKGTYGHLAIIAGSVGFTGAAVLAARGAQRARPGLITVITTPDAYPIVASQCQAVMVRPWTSAFKPGDEYSAVLVGPGLAGPDVPAEVPPLLRWLWRNANFPVIADASAIPWLEPAPTPRKAVRLLTPHPGEAGVLLRNSAAQVQAGRLEALRQIARRLGNAWVALKGHQTLVGGAEGPVFVNCSGGPHLAQGGSGDLLAGFLGGLIAQPAWQADPLLAARYAVWRHGAAADALEARQPNWVVEELAGMLGLVNAGNGD